MVASSDTGERQRHSESDDTAEEEFGPGPGSGSGAGGERLFKKTLRLSSEMIVSVPPGSGPVPLTDRSAADEGGWLRLAAGAASR